MTSDDIKKDEQPDTNGAEAASPSSELEGLKVAIEEEKKKYLYLRADFDNFRKQAIKERSDLIKFAGEPIIREMLSILDDLERAATSPLSAETLDKYKNGVELIVSTFKKSLERLGVEAVESKGLPFDPAIHEALSSVSDPTKESGSVVEVFRKPYRLHGKLVRPGQVVVNTAKKEE